MRKALKEKSVIAGTLNCLNGNQITATYTVEKFLGAGGSGLVYLCSDDSNKKYALKELYPKELEYMLKRIDDRVEYSAFAPEDVKASFEWYKQNLIRENQLCKQISSIRNLENNDPFFLDCKGILVINETTIYSVYETFYGFSLEEYIAVNKEKGNLNSIEYLSRILGIIAIIAKKTTLLHCQNILHLDISPSNILLVDYGAGLINSKDSDTPCLLDFGSAYKKDEETSINHRFSASEGYSAPEIVAKCQGFGDEYTVDESADTYSIVAVLYAAVMGETFDDPLGLYIHKQNNILSAFPKDVSHALAEIFTKGLHVEPWERFSSTEALANELLHIRALVSNENQDVLVVLSSIEQVIEAVNKFEETVNKRFDKIEEIVCHKNSLGECVRTFFNRIDCLLQIDIPDHKSHNGKKKIPLTFASFLSMCKYPGKNRENEHISNFRLTESILPSEYSEDEQTVKTINEMLSEISSSYFYEYFVSNYEVFFDRREFENSNNTNRICIRKKSVDTTVYSSADVINAIEFLYGAYINEMHEEYANPIKISLNYTISYAIASLVWNNHISMADPTSVNAFFEKVENLIKTHNHKDDYIFSLLEIRKENAMKNQGAFFFDPNDQKLYERIFNLVGDYYDDIYQTDYANPIFGRRLLTWLKGNASCMYMNACWHLIEKCHCYDARIWEALLTSESYSRQLRSYVLEKVFVESSSINEKIMFILLFDRSGDIIKYHLIPQLTSNDDLKKGYVDNYLTFIRNMVNILCEPRGRIDLDKIPLPSLCHAITRMLAYQNLLGGEYQTSSQLLMKVFTDRYGEKYCLPKNIPQISPSTAAQILSNDLSSYGSIFDLKDNKTQNYLAFFNILYNGVYGIKNEHSGEEQLLIDAYNECYTQILENALSQANDILKEYYKYLVLFNPRYCSERNRELLRNVLSSIIKNVPIYDHLSYASIVQLIDAFNFLFSKDELNDILIQNFIYGTLLLGSINMSQKTPQNSLLLFNKLCSKRLIDYNILFERINNAEYSEFFCILLMNLQKYTGYERIYIYPFVKLLLKEDRFCSLSALLKTQILVYTIGKREYDISKARLLQYYINEYEDYKNDNPFREIAFKVVLMASSSCEQVPDNVINDLISSITKDFKSGWESLGVSSAYQLKYTKRLVELFYEKDPIRVSAIAANALRVATGTLWVELKKIRNSDEKSYLLSRLEDLAFFIQFPSIKSLAKHYCDELNMELFSRESSYLIRNEKGDNRLENIIINMAEQQTDDTNFENIDIFFDEIDFILKEETPPIEAEVLQTWYRETGGKHPFDVSKYVILWKQSETKYFVIDGLDTLTSLAKHPRCPRQLTVKLFTPIVVNLKKPDSVKKTHESANESIEELHKKLCDRITIFEQKGIFVCKHNNTDIIEIKNVQKFESLKTRINSLLSFYRTYQKNSFRKLLYNPGAIYCLDGVRDNYFKCFGQMEKLYFDEQP